MAQAAVSTRQHSPTHATHHLLLSSFSCGFKIEVAGDARSLGQLVIAAVQHDAGGGGGAGTYTVGARLGDVVIEGSNLNVYFIRVACAFLTSCNLLRSFS
jgi:hypothetical protein